MLSLLFLAFSACGGGEAPSDPVTPPEPTEPPPPPARPPDTVTVLSDPVAITNVTLVPMDTETHLPGMTVVARDGVIQSVGTDGTLNIPAGAQRIDGTGLYLMPGLADMHTHISVINTLGVSPAAESAPDQGTLFVANGVTTVMNMGDFGGHDVVDLRDRFARGDELGPHIIAGHFARGATDGGQITYRATTDSEARAIVDRAARQGYDFVKVYTAVTGTAFNTIVDRSAQAGLPVFGHIPTAVGVESALGRGQRMIAHVSEYFTNHYNRRLDSALTPGAIRKAMTADGWVTTTLVASEGFRAAWGNNSAGLAEYTARPGSGARFTHPEIRQRWQFWLGLGGSPGQLDHEFPFILEYTHDFYRAGVNMMLGTDAADVAGVASGFSVHRELELLVEAGLTPFEALATATAAPGRFAAEVFPDQDRFGAIAEGYRADLILLGSDPLLDVANLQDRVGVLARGRWFPEADLQGRLEAIAARYGT